MRGLRENWWGRRVRRKSNNFRVECGTVKSTNLKMEGGKSEKVIDRIRAIPVPMSEKCVATRSSSRLMCTSTTKDNFMATDDFRRLLRGYVDVTDLFHTFRLVSKPWQRIAEEKIDEDSESGVLAFHDGNDISSEEVKA